MTQADQVEFRQALDEVDAGNSQEAEPVLVKLVERYRANSQVNEALGLIYAESGEMTRALPYLKRARNSAPQSALNHANLGTALLKLGHAREAVAELAIAARLDTRNAETFSKLGQAFMLLQDSANAVHAFSQAAALGPQSPNLFYNWAVALSQNGETEKASNVLDRIPEADRSDQSESLAGDVEEKLGHYLPAVKHYQAAAEKDPSEANLYVLCVEFLRHWAWDAATKTATYATEKYPDSTRLKLALGVGLYGSKSFPEAAKVFGGLLEREPGNAIFADMLGRTCGEIAGGNPDCDGLVSFSMQHLNNPVAAYYAALQILERPHSPADLDQAEQFLKRATAADATLADAWYQFGVLEAERQQWQTCARMLEKATALRPGFASAHYQLANAYAHLGRPGDRKKELTLFQTYSRKEKEQVNTKVQEMTVFLTNSK
jgi:tetratricopeptide (TPR) repeat protein